MVYESIRNRIHITKDEYADLVKKFEIIPLKEENRVIGGILLDGNEIHVGYGKKPKLSIRKDIRGIFNKLIDKLGFLETKVMENNESGIKFCKRLGFVALSKNNGIISMICVRSNYK
jgi:hypothetical protein